MFWLPYWANVVFAIINAGQAVSGSIPGPYNEVGRIGIFWFLENFSEGVGIKITMKNNRLKLVVTFNNRCSVHTQLGIKRCDVMVYN